MRLLDSLNILECSAFSAAGLTTSLADLGAHVVRVEPPHGDPGRATPGR